MGTEWDKHKFCGGALVLDLVNTVVYRDDPARRLDRLRTPDDFHGFSAAAAVFRRPDLEGASSEEFHLIIGLRERANSYFRGRLKGRDEGNHLLAELLSATGLAVKGANPLAFRSLAGISALRMLADEHAARIRACPNCHWLFVDQSRNGSRIWCDMTVCGNRHKARLHYRRSVNS